MKEDFAYRLKRAMQLRNIKASELSEKASIPKSAISQYLSGLYEAKQKSIFKLAKILNVSEGWLMGLDVPMERKEYVTAEQWQDIDELGNPISHIPLVGAVKAGYNYLAQENWIGTVDVETSLVGDGKDYFALKVIGDSMQPVLFEDDIVIVHKQSDIESGQVGIILIDGEEATIKKIIKHEDHIELIAFNSYYPIKKLTKDIDFKIIGKVTEARISKIFE